MVHQDQAEMYHISLCKFYQSNMTPQKKKLDNIVNFFIFHDSKIVKFINTAFSNEYIINKKCNVWIKDKITGIKQRSEVIKRIVEAIMSYDVNMNGVDKYNQSILYINLLIKTKR